MNAENKVNEMVEGFLNNIFKNYPVEIKLLLKQQKSVIETSDLTKYALAGVLAVEESIANDLALKASRDHLESSDETQHEKLRIFFHLQEKRSKSLKQLTKAIEAMKAEGK